VTLFEPLRQGPFPAVVLVPGSGEQVRLTTGDRGRVRAYVEAGFAVLVYDKRGSGASVGDARRAGYSELAGDALAALEWLRGRKDIRPDAIGLDGRSQGSWIVEIAASRSANIRFIV